MAQCFDCEKIFTRSFAFCFSFVESRKAFVDLLPDLQSISYQRTWRNSFGTRVLSAFRSTPWSHKATQIGNQRKMLSVFLWFFVYWTSSNSTLRMRAMRMDSQICFETAVWIRSDEWRHHVMIWIWSAGDSDNVWLRCRLRIKTKNESWIELKCVFGIRFEPEKFIDRIIW